MRKLGKENPEIPTFKTIFAIINSVRFISVPGFVVNLHI